MEEIVRHCESCTCYDPKDTNKNRLGQKISDFTGGDCAYVTFRLIVLEFMAKHRYSALKLSKETGVCYKTISGLVKGAGTRLSFSSITKIFSLMKDVGFADIK